LLSFTPSRIPSSLFSSMLFLNCSTTLVFPTFEVVAFEVHPQFVAEISFYTQKSTSIPSSVLFCLSSGSSAGWLPLVFSCPRGVPLLVALLDLRVGVLLLTKMSPFSNSLADSVPPFDYLLLPFEPFPFAPAFRCCSLDDFFFLMVVPEC